MSDDRHTLITTIIASLTARNAALEAALREIRDVSESIRIVLVNQLTEPMRSAFWKSIAIRNCADAALHPSPDDRAKVDVAEECARIAGGVAKENDTGSGFDSQVAYTTARRIERDIRTRFGRPA